MDYLFDADLALIDRAEEHPDNPTVRDMYTIEFVISCSEGKEYDY